MALKTVPAVVLTCEEGMLSGILLANSALFEQNQHLMKADAESLDFNEPKRAEIVESFGTKIEMLVGEFGKIFIDLFEGNNNGTKQVFKTDTKPLQSERKESPQEAVQPTKQSIPATQIDSARAPLKDARADNRQKTKSPLAQTTSSGQQ